MGQILLTICMSFLSCINVVLSFYSYDDGEMFILVTTDNARIYVKEVDWDKRYLSYSDICVIMNLQRGLEMDPVRARLYIMVYCGSHADPLLEEKAHNIGEQMWHDLSQMNIEPNMLTFASLDRSISVNDFPNNLFIQIFFKKLRSDTLLNFEAMSEHMANNIIEERKKNLIMFHLLDSETPIFTLYKILNRTFTLFELKSFTNHILLIHDKDEIFPKLFVWIGRGANRALQMRYSFLTLVVLHYKCDNNLNDYTLVFHEEEGHESALFMMNFHDWHELEAWV